MNGEQYRGFSNSDTYEYIEFDEKDFPFLQEELKPLPLQSIKQSEAQNDELNKALVSAERTFNNDLLSSNSHSTRNQKEIVSLKSAKSKIEQIKSELKSFANKFRSKNSQSCQKTRGRPRGKKTNKRSNVVKNGSRKYLKGSQQHRELLRRRVESVRKCREKKAQKKLDLDESQIGVSFGQCKHCSKICNIKSVKMHESKCHLTSKIVACPICKLNIKALGLENHLKTCKDLEI